MSYHKPLVKKSSGKLRRFQVSNQDMLDQAGFVSKGDTTLLDIGIQESYYKAITARFMRFCSQHSNDLDQAYQALADQTIDSKTITSSQEKGTGEGVWNKNRSSNSTAASTKVTESQGSQPFASRSSTKEELSIILISLRKLREAILATSKDGRTPVFSQRVHVFNIRLAVLALEYESYHASLRFLLNELNTSRYPLPMSELREMTSYLILDTALRLENFNEAYRIRTSARQQYGIANSKVDKVLQAVSTGDWPLFWKMYNSVDGYLRALMQVEKLKVRSQSLKVIGRAYMKSDVAWILQASTNGELNWNELLQAEDVGWQLDGTMVSIRKPKIKNATG